jgi:hypothetical protein
MRSANGVIMRRPIESIEELRCSGAAQGGRAALAVLVGREVVSMRSARAA